MNTIAGRLEQQYPESNTGRGIRVVSLSEQIVGNFRTSLLVILGAVVFVLLIGSANVANMSLARTAARQKEMAIRTALGAGRARIVRLLLTESVLLSLFSGLVGLLVAIWGIDLLVALSPPDLPRVKEVTIDLRVLGFTLAVSLLTGILFGILPALRASRPNLNERLKAGGRSASGTNRQHLRGFLVVAEIALSLVLLVGAGLLIRSFLRLQAVNPGFNPTNVLTMQIDLSWAKLQDWRASHSFPTTNFFNGSNKCRACNTRVRDHLCRSPTMPRSRTCALTSNVVKAMSQKHLQLFITPSAPITSRR